MILSTSFSAWLSTFLPLAFCCLLPLGARVLLPDLSLDLSLDLLPADLFCSVLGDDVPVLIDVPISVSTSSSSSSSCCCFWLTFMTV